MSTVVFHMTGHSGGTVDQKDVVWSDHQCIIVDWNLAKKQDNWLLLKNLDTFCENCALNNSRIECCCFVVCFFHLIRNKKQSICQRL